LEHCWAFAETAAAHAGMLRLLGADKKRSEEETMLITRERFNGAMTYDDAKGKMPRNTPNMDRIEGQIKLTDADLKPWRNLPDGCNVLVLVIDPCPDVYTNLPILQQIATETGKLNIRVLMRDENKDLMAQFMNGPYESVPVILFLDKDMELRSVFIERPKSVTALREQKTREIHDAHPEFGAFGRSPAEMGEEIRPKFQAAVNEMRTATTDYYIGESLKEFREIAEELARGVSGDPKWRGNLIGAVAA
jgi:hypothetical protein